MPNPAPTHESSIRAHDTEPDPRARFAIRHALTIEAKRTGNAHLLFRVWCMTAQDPSTSKEHREELQELCLRDARAVVVGSNRAERRVA